MKTLTHLTTCLILLLSSQTFSQDSVMSGGGMGGSDMGSVDVDVPNEDGHQDEPQPGQHDNDDPAPNPEPDSTANPNPDASDSPTLTVTPPASNPLLSIAQTTVISNSPSIRVTEWHIPFIGRRPHSKKGDNYPVPYDKKWKTPRDRPLITNKDRDIKGCPNQGDGSTKDPEVTIEPPFQMPPPYLCDCCCHMNSSRVNPLTSSSDNWDDYQTSTDAHDDRYKDDRKKDNSNKDTRYNDDRKKDNGGCNKTNNKNPHESEETDNDTVHSDDDCDCNCKCKKTKGFAMFD